MNNPNCTLSSNSYGGPDIYSEEQVHILHKAGHAYSDLMKEGEALISSGHEVEGNVVCDQAEKILGEGIERAHGLWHSGAPPLMGDIKPPS